MPTIKQVAEHARVSVATVSRVINKTGYVSLDLQERVNDAMRELNYQPSALARSLRRQETHTVGLLVPQLNHPFFSTLVFSIEKILFDHDYRAFMCSAEESQEKEAAYVDMLLRQRVDGVIMVPTGTSVGNVGRLVEHNVPVVLVDRDMPGLRINRVLCDNEQGGYDGMRHLLELGHRRMTLLGGPDHSVAMTRRMQGAQRALAEAEGVEAAEIVLFDALEQFAQAYQWGLQALSQPDRPTAVFALTDFMAVALLHAARKHRLIVPDEISVMGYDDISMARYSIPELTTIRQPLYEMGMTAAEILLGAIGGDSTLHAVMLDTELIVRQSTAAPPG
jgi:LacI family transcriptional regulator